MNSFVYFFVAIITGIVMLGHFVVYRFVTSVIDITSLRSLIVLRSIFAILSLSFVTMTILAMSYNTTLTRFLYTLSAGWLGLLFYLFLSAVTFGILVFVRNSISSEVSLNWVGYVLFFIALCTWGYGIYHAQDIQIKKVDIEIPNLPSSWKGKKAIWVSDVHLGQIRSKDFLQRIVTLIQRQNPDIVFIGGDLYDGVKVNEKEIISPLSSLKTPLGVYFITGNHEEFSDNVHFINAVRSVGVQVLNNEKVLVSGMDIIGVDDKDSASRNSFIKLMDSFVLASDTPSILLKHQPKDIDVAEKSGVSLQISGHTHRAQMWPLGIVPRLVYKGFDYGLRSLGSTQVFTSSGVGTWGPPVRVGSDAEIVEITFK